MTRSCATRCSRGWRDISAAASRLERAGAEKTASRRRMRDCCRTPARRGRRGRDHSVPPCRPAKAALAQAPAACAENEALRTTLCAVVPASATVTEVQVFTRLEDAQQSGMKRGYRRDRMPARQDSKPTSSAPRETNRRKSAALCALEQSERPQRAHSDLIPERKIWQTSFDFRFPGRARSGLRNLAAPASLSRLYPRFIPGLLRILEACKHLHLGHRGRRRHHAHSGRSQGLVLRTCRRRLRKRSLRRPTGWDADDAATPSAPRRRSAANRASASDWPFFSAPARSSRDAAALMSRSRDCISSRKTLSSPAGYSSDTRKAHSRQPAQPVPGRRSPARSRTCAKPACQQPVPRPGGARWPSTGLPQ